MLAPPSCAVRGHRPDSPARASTVAGLLTVTSVKPPPSHPFDDAAWAVPENATRIIGATTAVASIVPTRVPQLVGVGLRTFMRASRLDDAGPTAPA